jgi:membrane protein DedA with SNARE-associated domain
MPLDQITAWLLHLKYLALFPLAAAEGPIVTIITGFFSSLGYINFWLAYLIIVAGDLTGDLAHYSAGRFGGRKFIDRWGKYIGVGPHQIEKLEEQFAKRGDKLLFIGKMLHGAGGAFLIAAGIIKMPLKKFLSANFLATLLKSMILLIIGYYFGRAFITINGYLEKITLISLGLAVLAGLIYFFYIRKKSINSVNL